MAIAHFDQRNKAQAIGRRTLVTGNRGNTASQGYLPGTLDKIRGRIIRSGKAATVGEGELRRKQQRSDKREFVHFYTFPIYWHLIKRRIGDP